MRPKHFWCRKCRRSGDIINFLEQYYKISIRQACAILEINPSDENGISVDTHSVQKHGRSGPTEDQVHTLEMLMSVYPYAQQMLTHPRALAYLAARSIPLEVAQALGVGYIPARSEGVAIADSDDQWCDKILFPAQSSIGEQGFRGRTLTRWQPGMDENAHRKVLEIHDIAPWLATYGDCYFNLQTINQSTCPVFTEGGFDVLACQAAGIQAIPVGTNRLPSLRQVRQVILALDSDGGGRTATAWFASQLRALGIGYRVCVPPAGAKDWAEAYRLFGIQGLSVLQETLKTLQFCEDCDLSNFASKKPFQEHDGHLYCSLCCPVKMNKPPVVVPDAFEAAPENCADCGTHMTDDSREFFYWATSDNTFLCFCTSCRDQQTGQRLTESEPIVEPQQAYLSTAEQVKDLAEQIAPGTYVLDLETTGLSPRKNKIITIALGTPDTVSTIDVRGFYDAREEIQGQWRKALQALLHREDITWAGHNLKFDWAFLAVQFRVRLRKVYDTMLVERLIHNGERTSVSLLNTAARYDIKVTKEARNWFIDLDTRLDEWHAVLPPDQLTYIEQDIRVPHQLMDKQQEAIKQFGLKRVIDLENEALPAIAAMEVRGITVDVARWKRILQTKQTRRSVLEAQLKQVLGLALASREEIQQGLLFGERALPDINLGSRQQMLAALEVLGVTVESLKAEALEAVKDTHEVVPLLLEWKELEKLVTAFGESLLQHVETDGRIHANFDQLGADSGRLTCREPNLQQIPKPQDEDSNLRRCFIAQDGCKLLVADLSNIELRILAEASQDPTMLRFFAEGKDLHSETAKLMFNLPPETDTKKHLINGVKARDIAKTINFGLAYGMGPSGLANRVGVEMGTAKQLMQTYFATYKGVDGYLKRSGRRGVNEGYAVSLSGRRRMFAQESLADPAKRGGVERAAKNHPIQGTNADILKRALALLFERLPNDVHVVLTVHDEIVLETPVTIVDSAEAMLKESMMEACRDFLKRVVIPEPDVLIADYWVKG
jgi:DNA polymerase-1